MPSRCEVERVWDQCMSKRDKTGTEEKTARRVAVQCLVRWCRDRKALQPHIEATVYQAHLAANDRQLGVMLVQGVLRQMQYLDRIIASFSRFPPAKMKPLTIMALRVGIFQLLCLDRIPDSAAVNETVKVLRDERQPRWLINFVNGILRAVARQKSSIIAPGDQAQTEEFVTNHPRWLVRRWEKMFGPGKALQICAANNREPNLVLRVNTLLTTPEELTAELAAQSYGTEPGHYAPASIRMESFSGTITKLPGYEAGLFHVQDEAAQLATLLLGPFEGGLRYLDACAGLGGKTCYLGQLISSRDRITAVEPSIHRFTVLGQNIERLRLEKRLMKYQGRLDDFISTGPEPFDRILVDAPCSGTGVLGRHPDIRWNRQPEDLPALQTKQLELLLQAASLLKPGGVLVYATCSLEPEENEQVVASFLQEKKDFLSSDARDFLPQSALDLVDSDGFFRPTPAEGLDGFFGARLVRKH